MLRRAVRVCLLGASPRTGNQGVSALNASLLKLVFEARPDAEVTLLISHRSPGMHAARVAGREHMVRLVNCRLSPRARPREHLLAIVALCLAYRLTPSAAARGRIAALSPWVRALAEADFVGDIRGGDSFSDIYGLGRFMLNAVPALTAMLLGRKLVLLPQTYGPYGSPLARAVAAFTLRRAARVLSRDREGVAAAERLVRGRRGAPRPEFCPDVAFALEARPPPSPVIRPPLDPAAAAPPVGLNVNGLMYRGGYTRGNMFRLKCDYAEYARRLAARILASRPETRLLLVPHTFGPPGGLNSDPDACREVIAALPAGLKERASLVAAGYDQHEIKGIVGLCGQFVGSRMHACIAALSQGIPAVGAAYSDKFAGVFASVGAGDRVVDLRALDTEEALAKTMALLASADAAAADLKAAVAAAKRRLGEVFGALLAPAPGGEADMATSVAAGETVAGHDR